MILKRAGELNPFVEDYRDDNLERGQCCVPRFHPCMKLCLSPRDRLQVRCQRGLSANDRHVGFGELSNGVIVFGTAPLLTFGLLSELY